jgi:hypothetical protein
MVACVRCCPALSYCSRHRRQRELCVLLEYLEPRNLVAIFVHYPDYVPYPDGTLLSPQSVTRFSTVWSQSAHLFYQPCGVVNSRQVFPGLNGGTGGCVWWKFSCRGSRFCRCWSWVLKRSQYKSGYKSEGTPYSWEMTIKLQSTKESIPTA